MYAIAYRSFGLIREISVRKAKKTHVCTLCGLYIKRDETYIRIDIKNLRHKHVKSYYICKSCLGYLRMLKSLND